MFLGSFEKSESERELSSVLYALLTGERDESSVCSVT